jgi:hypothetical protein
MQGFQNDLKLKDNAKKVELDQLKQDLEMKNKLYTKNVLNEMILDSINNIYNSNGIKNV